MNDRFRCKAANKAHAVDRWLRPLTQIQTEKLPSKSPVDAYPASVRSYIFDSVHFLDLGRHP